MAAKILVTYGTKYGATAEIAERIGKTFLEEGLQAEVVPVKDAGELPGYQAIVIGSAVYIGQWRKDVANFLKNNQTLLSGCPVWLFSSGPSGEGDPVELLKGWRYPKGLQAVIDNIKPRDIAVFHGLVKPEKMNLIEKWMIKKVKSPVGDFRDWDTIRKWASGIAAALKEI